MHTAISCHRRTVNGIKLHYTLAGDGPPVVLLHGFPETSHTWRRQLPVLSRHYQLIVPDLRGYGFSDKPVSGYDKRTMANDIKELLATLGISRAAVIGHDRGARVATRLVKDHPSLVARFAALDNIPTRMIFERMNADVAQATWFIFFNGVRDLPEALVQGREEMWLRYIFTSWLYDISAISDADIEIYRRAYAAPGGLRGAFEDYRAWRQDFEQDKEDAHVKISVPTLALWGAEFDGAKIVDMRELWSEMASDLTCAPIALAGHFPHAERPIETNEALLAFLRDWKG
ncbi:alpha/beta hydrolase [Paraburkholderia edwinii]|uniref:Alpha/beta hydrolase n=1 Tax=Paraburkholderia edwinii TaxID=2861782 RepID=A0ABX8UX72_9BURK|nr:alpha/beta hydrolase [Paraburkholderia edwinii]QYD73608.1 alpha/beta hydrolase [Paraburkholderia edwinii]